MAEALGDRAGRCVFTSTGSVYQEGYVRKRRAEFGFRTTPLSEWVAAAVRWYRDEYRGPDSKGYGQRARELELARVYPERQADLAAALDLGAREW